MVLDEKFTTTVRLTTAFLSSMRRGGAGLIVARVDYGCGGIRQLPLSHPTSTFSWEDTFERTSLALAVIIPKMSIKDDMNGLSCDQRDIKGITHLHVLSVVPGTGGPQAI